MSYTNKTTHYELPQYVATDIPSILTDLNGAYQTIDEAIFAIATQQSGTTSDITALGLRIDSTDALVAQNANNLANEITARENADTNLNTAIGQANTAIGGLNTRVTALEQATVSADRVSYTDVGSHLGANNVQDAIEALDAEGHKLLGELQTTTLTAGSTSATINFTQEIVSTTIITPVCSAYGVNPTSVTYSSSSITLTFEAQASDMIIGARIQNVV